SHNYDQAFFDVIDPGSTANNTSVAHSGDFYLTYTLPADATGSYFYMGIMLQYSANGYYGPVFDYSTTPVSLGTVDGQTTYVADIPYTINAGNFYGFGFGIMTNSDYKSPSAGPLFLDN